MEIDLIQTLKDKGNSEEVIEKGPFRCVRPHAWLGYGYYFWDTHISLGHWWGSTTIGSNYIICKAEAILDSSCWDLHGNQRHLSEFRTFCDEMIKQKVSTPERLKVPQVIEFAKKFKSFNYKAIRALGLNSMTKSSLFHEYIHFDDKLPAYFDLLPPIQICLIEKSALSLKNFSIIYPDEYCTSSFI